MDRPIGIALALAAGAVIAAMLYAGSGPYYPVARVTSPEGLVFTAFSDSTRERDDCREANERFLEPFRKSCPGCRVISARCESRRAAQELRAALNDPIVRSPGLTLFVAGPRELARAACEQIAGDLLKRGIRDSRCLASGP